MFLLDIVAYSLGNTKKIVKLFVQIPRKFYSIARGIVALMTTGCFTIDINS